MNKIDILVISNRFDFTTDYVCLELEKRNARYFRINRDDFAKYRIQMDVLNRIMSISVIDQLYQIDNELIAVYYRAPIYLRDIYKPELSKEEQLYRTQWTAFIRNLTIFENAIWVNNPIATFKAENKLLQLVTAQSIGFLCPNTIVTNDNTINTEVSNDYIVKTLDTAVLRIEEKEAFIYSNRIKGNEIKDFDLSIAPVVIQDYIDPKIDIRVTVIGEMVYSVRILKDNRGIDGDWRIMKESVQFIPFELPKQTKRNCIELVKALGLSFGGIDLIESKNGYYFIEVNPTGEWAWLINTANLPIYEGICNYLEGGSKSRWGND